VGGQADGDLNCDMGCSNNWGVAPSADLEGFYDLPSLPVCHFIMFLAAV